MGSTPSRTDTADRRFYGLMPGLVVDDLDPEAQGRVRLQFPWFDPATTSDWARVATPYAGPKYGAVWTPEKGSEVLIGFEFGDMRFPYVVGSLYNGADAPPTSRSSSLDQKVFHTKKGHRVVLDDAKDEILLEHSSGQSTIRLTSTSVEIEATNIKLTASGLVEVKAATIKLN